MFCRVANQPAFPWWVVADGGMNLAFLDNHNGQRILIHCGRACYDEILTQLSSGGQNIEFCDVIGQRIVQKRFVRVFPNIPAFQVM